MVISVALGLTLIVAFTDVYDIHHVLKIINESHIASALGHRFDRDTKALIDDRSQMQNEAIAQGLARQPFEVFPITPGYGQKFNWHTLVDCARRNDWVAQVCRGLGDLTMLDTPTTLAHARTALTAVQTAQLRDAFTTGDDHTESLALTVRP